MANVGDLVANLSLNFSEFIEGLKLSEHEMEHFGEVAKEVAAGLGLAFGVEKVIESIHGQIEAVNDLIHSSERLNISANALQAFAHEAELAGVGLEEVTKGLAMMQKNIVEAVTGSKDLGLAFGRIGINAEDIIGLKADQQFLLLSEAIRQVGNDADRVELAKVFFGRGGVSLMTLIEQGKVGFDDAMHYVNDLGISIDELTEKNFKQLEEDLIYLKDTWGKLWREMAQDVTPVVKAVVDAIDIMNHGIGSKWAKQYLPDYVTRNTGGKSLKEWASEADAEKEAQAKQSAAVSQAKMEASAKAYANALKQAQAIHESLISPVEKLQEEYKKAMELFAKGALPGDDLHRIQQKIIEESQKAAEKLKKPWQDAARELVESLETPIEKAEEKFKEAQLLFDGGFISEDTLTKAWDALQDAIEKADDDALQPFIKHQEEMMQKADKLWEEAETPLQKYKDKIAEITDLWMQGFLDDQQAGQAVFKAASDYKKATQPHSETKSDFKSVGLERGSKEDLQSIVDAVTRNRPKNAQQQVAQHTQQIAQHVVTISQTNAQIAYSLKGLKSFDLGTM